MRSSCAFAVLLLASMTSVRSAEAQGGESAEPPAYRDTIRVAIEEYESKSYAEARDQFRRAHAIYPNARTLRGLGLAAYELHDYVESIRCLEEALRSDVKPLEGTIRSDTELVLNRARGYVGTVVLELDPSTTILTVDGQEAKPPYLEPLVLPVGEHILEFRAPGRLQHRRTVEVIGGATQVVKVALAGKEFVAASHSAAMAPISEERDPKETPAYKKWWVWTLVAGAVAGGVVGILYATRGEVERAGTANTPSGGILSTQSSR